MAANRILALLIVVATAAFAIGISLEESDEHTEPAEATHAEGGEAEGAGEVGQAETEAGEAEAETNPESDEENLLGINLESTPLVVLAVVGSLALASGAWLRPGLRALLGLIALAMLAFAALDVREVFHQADESNLGLATLAGVIAGVHLAAGALAIKLQGSRTA